MEDKRVVLNLLYDRQHEVSRFQTFLLENESCGLVQATLFTRVRFLHDIAELELLEDLFHAGEHICFFLHERV